MEIIFFFKGVLLGLIIALAVGPVAILCVRRTLTHGWFYGFLTTFGTAFGDFAYAYLAQFGAPFILKFIVAYHVFFKLISGLFLLLIGYHIYISKVEDPNVSVVNKDLPEDFLTTFLLTFTNPLPILFLSTSFAAILQHNPGASKAALSMLPFGVFFGSLLWWLALSIGAGFFRNYVTKARLAIINKVTGMALIAFGVFFLLTLGMSTIKEHGGFHFDRIWPSIQNRSQIDEFER